MLSKNECLQVINSMMTNTTDEKKKNKLIKFADKINSKSEEQLQKIAKETLGENCEIGDFQKWITDKLERKLVGTEFVELNDMVSYNIAGGEADTLALHVGPKKLSHSEIRNMGPYLVDALDQLREKVENGEIKGITNVFAVSDILKINTFREAFLELGFNYGEGDEAFKDQFKRTPYQAEILIENFMSEEWKQLRDKFMEKQPEIDVHARAKADKLSKKNQDPGDDSENR